ncbi:MAG: ATP phosphoribosyltransferase [Chloroflexi bacterium]|nr:ATP phosphoribosyltransferase [Chloroflexota bacterium]
MFTLALPNSGRLAEPVRQLMEQAGLPLGEHLPSRALQVTYPKLDLRVVFTRPKDAGKLIEGGYIDLAISAQDILAEYPARVKVFQKLNLGKCSVVVAVRQDSSFQRVQDLEGRVIATGYSSLTHTWFLQQGIGIANIVVLHGALEIAPWLGCCDGIVDSYQTGLSARANQLKVLATVMTSEAVLIGQPEITFPEPIVFLLDKLAQLM